MSGIDISRWPHRSSEGGVPIPPVPYEKTGDWAESVLGQPAATWSNGWACHMRCGLHSGFPRCCIRYWCREWSVQTGIQRYIHACAIVAAERIHGRGYNYIPCPRCVYEPRKPFDINVCPEDSPCGRRRKEFRERRDMYHQMYPASRDSLGMRRFVIKGEL